MTDVANLYPQQGYIPVHYDNDNDNDNENMFVTIDLHIYRIQDARYKYTENKHLTLFFLW